MFRKKNPNSGYIAQAMLLLVALVGLSLFYAYFQFPQYRDKFLEVVSPKIIPKAQSRNVDLIQFDPYEAYEDGTLRNKISSRKVNPGQNFVYFASSMNNSSSEPTDINIIIWLGNSLNYVGSESFGGSCNWYSDTRKLNCYYRGVVPQGRANVVLRSSVSSSGSGQSTTTLFLKGSVGPEITTTDTLTITSSPTTPPTIPPTNPPTSPPTQAPTQPPATQVPATLTPTPTSYSYRTATPTPKITAKPKITTKPTVKPSTLKTPTPSPIPKSGPAPEIIGPDFLNNSLLGEGEGSIIKIYAAGSSSRKIYPNMQLLINDKVVWTFLDVEGNYKKREFVEFSYKHRSKLTPKEVKIAFTNDYVWFFWDRNLYVEKINIDGVDYLTKSPGSYSTGNWSFFKGCYSGNTQKEALRCNGYFSFGE
jgi:hypothetical protein